MLPTLEGTRVLPMVVGRWGGALIRFQSGDGDFGVPPDVQPPAPTPVSRDLPGQVCSPTIRLHGFASAPAQCWDNSTPPLPRRSREDKHAHRSPAQVPHSGPWSPVCNPPAWHQVISAALGFCAIPDPGSRCWERGGWLLRDPQEASGPRHAARSIVLREAPLGAES